MIPCGRFGGCVLGGGADMSVDGGTPREPSRWRRMSREPGQKFSEILAAIAADDSLDRVKVADLVGAMGDRAFGPLLFVFALPNILPAPPGTSGVLAIPLVFLAIQLMFGRKPWLPGFIASRSVKGTRFRRPSRSSLSSLAVSSEDSTSRP